METPLAVFGSKVEGEKMSAMVRIKELEALLKEKHDEEAEKLEREAADRAFAEKALNFRDKRADLQDDNAIMLTEAEKKAKKKADRAKELAKQKKQGKNIMVERFSILRKTLM